MNSLKRGRVPLLSWDPHSTWYNKFHTICLWVMLFDLNTVSMASDSYFRNFIGVYQSQVQSSRGNVYMQMHIPLILITAPGPFHACVRGLPVEYVRRSYEVWISIIFQIQDLPAFSLLLFHDICKAFVFLAQRDKWVNDRRRQCVRSQQKYHGSPEKWNFRASLFCENCITVNKHVIHHE